MVPLLLLVLPALLACGAAPPPPPPEPLLVTIEELSDVGDHPLAAEESRLMSDRVAARREGEHGALPPVEQQDGASPDAWPVVAIKNDTPHGLVVWFSGPCPRTVALIPGAEQVTELCEGSYGIAAELAADDFLPFANDGDQLDNGFLYGLSFYVVAEPRTRRGRRGRRGGRRGMRRR